MYILLLGLITNNNKEIIFVNKGLIFLQKFNQLFNREDCCLATYLKIKPVFKIIIQITNGNPF